MVVDLGSALDRLYAGSPDDFIERRKALVAEARAAKDRSLATTIGSLRRPTRSAWLVNLYARTRQDELTALLDLGAALQAAQKQLSAPELRRLSAERHRAVAAATGRAVELGQEQGYAASEAVEQEVSGTLQAALADPEVADRVRVGTVTEAQTYVGFGPFGGMTPATVPEAAEEDREEDARAQEDARAEAARRLAEAEAALSEAADRADEATGRADELADRIDALRTELAETEQAEAEARDQARAARRRVAELAEAAQAARQAYESAEPDPPTGR